MEPKNNNIVQNYDESVCFVPGVCFDKNGNRIGYGKGYYDKFLKDYNGTKIGITYKSCITDDIEVDKYDIKMDKVVSN